MKRVLLIVVVAGSVVACARILGFREAGPRAFPHRAHVTKGVTCVQCHKGITEAGDTGPLHLPDTAACIGCHEAAHDTRECSTCHGEAITREAATQARTYLRFSHTAHVPRARGNCVRCHSDVAQEASTLRPSMATCFGCHEHEDQFRVRECDGCHIDLPAELTRPSDHLVHDGDWMRDHGVRAASSDLCSTCHSQRFCASCHGVSVPALGESIAFDEVMRGGVHRAGFRARHAAEARTQPGLCNTCHKEDACQRCHSERGLSATALDARSPHGAGWLGPPGSANQHGRAAWRNPAECASCHGGAGESMCVSCHRVGGIGGTPHPLGWSSRMSKRDMPCVLCHGGTL
jgi:hypothetical protein